MSLFPFGKRSDLPPDREIFLTELQGQLKSLYNFARWLTQDPDEAEDVVHDGLSRVLAGENLNISGEDLRSYLFTVIRRTYINRLRRGRYEVTSEQYPEDEESLPGEAEPWSLRNLPPELVRRDLNRALASLPEDSRSVVVLSDVEGCTIEEVARIMGIPAGTVKSKLWRAHQALQKKLRAYHAQGKRV